MFDPVKLEESARRFLEMQNLNSDNLKLEYLASLGMIEIVKYFNSDFGPAKYYCSICSYHRHGFSLVGNIVSHSSQRNHFCRFYDVSEYNHFLACRFLEEQINQLKSFSEFISRYVYSRILFRQVDSNFISTNNSRIAEYIVTGEYHEY